MMKKPIARRLAALMLFAAVLLSLTHCGSRETESGEVVGAPEPGKTYTLSDGRLYYLSLDLSEYVTVPAYTGLTVEVDSAAIDAAVEAQLKDVACTYATMSTTKTVAENDIVLCSFTGYVDGKQFLTGSGEQIEVTENGYDAIPGFAEGLAGATAGTVHRMTLTLPDDYEDPAYAGKQATFTVTIGYVFTPSLTDANVKDYTSGEYRTVKAYRTYLREQEYRSAAENALFLQIKDGATILKPDDAATEFYYRELVDQIEAGSGMSYGDYLTEYGYTDGEIREMAKTSYEYNLVLYRIVQLEGIQVFESDYNVKFEQYVQAYLASAGSSVSRAEAEAYVEENREAVISSCLEEKVFTFLLAKNTVKEK